MMDNYRCILYFWTTELWYKRDGAEVRVTRSRDAYESLNATH